MRTRKRTLRFRAERFEELLRDRGLDAKTTAQKAELLGVSRPHFERVVRGETRPGTSFVLGALTAFPGTDLTTLFEEVAS